MLTMQQQCHRSSDSWSSSTHISPYISQNVDFSVTKPGGKKKMLFGSSSNEKQKIVLVVLKSVTDSSLMEDCFHHWIYFIYISPHL